MQDQEQPQEPASLGEVARSLDFWAGFVGWFVLFILYQGLVSEWGFATPVDSFFMNCLLPLSLLVMIVLAVRRRSWRVGAGLITGVAASLLAARLVGITFDTQCLF